MTPRKLRLLITTFSYGGNGGISSEVPDVRDWLLWNLPTIEADPRIELVHPKARKKLLEIADTPVTMSRNAAVVAARKVQADLLLMIDSDMRPDNHLDEPGAVPFWEAAFEEIYAHWDKGPLVVGAPYCGPGPENVYVFRWANWFTGDPDDCDFRIEGFGREEAARLAGVQEVAALPTGLILFDNRAFELTEPSGLSRRDILRKVVDREIDIAEAERLLEPGWFYYEFSDGYAARKASTEDVTVTRDISLVGTQKLGYNPLRCAWDSWAGHWKPKCVGKPVTITADQVGQRFKAALERPHSELSEVDASSLLEGNGNRLLSVGV